MRVGWVLRIMGSKKDRLRRLLELLPTVDEDEQREIDEIAGSPSDYADEGFVEWDLRR